MLYLNRKELESDVTNSYEFRAMTVAIIEAIGATIDDTMIDYAMDFVPPESYLTEDDPHWSHLRDLALVSVTSYLLQKPVSEDDVIDSRHLNYEHAKSYFKNVQSPVGEKPESDEIAALRAENLRLRREKHEAEQLAIAALRKNPSRRHKRYFSSLDEYLENKVDDAVQAALGYTC